MDVIVLSDFRLSHSLSVRRSRFMCGLGVYMVGSQSPSSQRSRGGHSQSQYRPGGVAVGGSPSINGWHACGSTVDSRSLMSSVTRAVGISSPEGLDTDARISGLIRKPRALAHGSGRLEDLPSLLSRSGAGKANAGPSDVTLKPHTQHNGAGGLTR